MYVASRYWSCCLAVVISFAAQRADAQSAETGKTQFPANPAAWLNSQPISTDMLAGKAALLWFFEEDCPRCRDRWPSMFEAAQKFDGKPIVFIAVNSGNPPADIQQYARDVNLKWPVIVDPDRSFEKACGLETEISLQNIYQSRLLLPDGQLVGGGFDIEAGATQALAGAKWRVEPSEVPEGLKAAWLQVEFGNFSAAAPTIRKNLASPKTDLKAAADKLWAAVEGEMAAQVKAAEQAAAAGQKWPAYKQYALVANRFKGYDLPSETTAALKELGNDELVRKEVAASKQWEAAQRQLASPAGVKAAAPSLRRIVTQFPGTEAAGNAQAALDRLSTN